MSKTSCVNSLRVKHSFCIKQPLCQARSSLCFKHICAHTPCINHSLVLKANLYETPNDTSLHPHTFVNTPCIKYSLVSSTPCVKDTFVSNTPWCQVHLVLKLNYCIKHPVTQVNTPFTKAHLVVATPLVSKHTCARHPLCQTRNIHCFKQPFVKDFRVIHTLFQIPNTP